MNIVGDIINNLRRNLPFTQHDEQDTDETASQGGAEKPASGGDNREASTIKVSEVMTTDIASVSRITRIADAARAMRDNEVGFLPVIDDGNLVGVITDRDITVRVVAEGRDPAATPVDRYYTPRPITVAPSASLQQAAEIMGSQQIRRLLVVDRGKVVGVLSLGDVAVEGHDTGEAGDVLTEVSEPGGPHQNEPNHK